MEAKVQRTNIIMRTWYSRGGESYSVFYRGEENWEESVNDGSEYPWGQPDSFLPDISKRILPDVWWEKRNAVCMTRKWPRTKKSGLVEAENESADERTDTASAQNAMVLPEAMPKLENKLSSQTRQGKKKTALTLGYYLTWHNRAVLLGLIKQLK